VSGYLARRSSQARRELGKKQRSEAFRMCMLSVRGRFDPPRWALERLSPGDLAEYRAALEAQRQPGEQP